LTAAHGGASAFSVAAGRSLRHVLHARRVLLAVILFGILLRAVLYAANRSLTLDESFVALNIERRSAGKLLGQLDWNSAAPTAFLELEKALSIALGGSEHVLRAAPFFASLLGLIVFAKLAAQLAQPYAVSFAVLLFAGLGLTISYAALAKPYAFDVLFVTAIYVATLHVLSNPNRSSLIGLTVLGVVAPAFSYASVFAVAASASLLVSTTFAPKSTAQRIRILSVVGGWSALFLTWYFWHGNTVSHLQRSFGSEYLDSSASIHSALGALRIVLGVSPDSAHVGTTLAAIATGAVAVFFVAGVVELARRGWQAPALLLLPGVFVAIASAAHLYPLAPRTMLFLTPTLVVCVAMGFVALHQRMRGLVSQGAVIALMTVMIVAEASTTIHSLAPLRGDEGIKPVMRTLATRQLPGDSVYISYASQYPFAYYLECNCAGTLISAATRRHLWNVNPTPGNVDQWAPALRSRSGRTLIGAFQGYGLESYDRDLEKLRNRGRVWIVATFLDGRERAALSARLDQLGQRVASFGQGSGVDAVTTYLYIF